MGLIDWNAIVSNLLLFSLVFGMSATVDTKRMNTQIRNYRAILTGLFCQFIILPLMGFLAIIVLDVHHAVGVTLLVVTSSPGGSYSNWWCSLFNGDLALSVSMTAISTILSIGTLPLNLLFYSQFAFEDDVVDNLDWNSLFMALAVVITAISLGLFCSYRFNSVEFNKLANKLGNVSGLCLIFFSAFLTNSGDADTKIWARSASFYGAVTFPCIAGLVIANSIASALKLKKPEQVTVAIECCYQNVGIATSVALTMFDDKDLNHAMGVPFLYGLIEAVVVGLYCVVAWKLGWTKAPASAPLHTVLFTSYEVETVEAEKGEEQKLTGAPTTVVV